jgi:large subunit ribosomal protein L21
MYAIVRTGGRQYRAEVGALIDVERLPNEVGEEIELKDVLLVANSDGVKIGQPLVESASVTATVVDQFKGKKSHRLEIYS